MKTTTRHKTALIVFGIIFSLSIVEGSLRFFGWALLYLQEKRNTAPIVVDDARLDSAQHREIVVVCIGESTTAMGGDNSWPRQLQRILNSTQNENIFRVINKGVAGSNTTWMLANLPMWIKTYNPDIVLAMAGINDRSPAFPSEDPLPSFGARAHRPSADTVVLSEERSEEVLSKAWRVTNLLGYFRTYGLIEWIADGIRNRMKENGRNLAMSTTIEGAESDGLSRVYGLQHPGVTHLLPHTIENLNNMVNLTTDAGVTFGFVQYALRRTDILESVIERKRNVIFISNFESFTEMLEKYTSEELFIDWFAGDFGHATILGDRIIGDNVAKQLLTYIDLRKSAQ